MSRLASRISPGNLAGRPEDRSGDHMARWLELFYDLVFVAAIL